MISRYIRNHTQSATAGIALGLIGIVLLYNGTLDLPSLDESDRDWLIATCLSGAFICFGLSFLCLTRRIVSSRGMEIATATGLAAAIVANFVTGFLWPDSLWITCGYSMTLAVAAGLTLRTPFALGSVLLLLMLTWLVAADTHTSELDFRGDATTLVGIGVVIAIGVFSILRFERQGQQDLTRQLRTQLDHDALTGVLNRTGLLSGLNGLRADPGGSGRIWCAYIDVDYFKSINDQRGHDFGDDVLCEIARGLVEICGENGLVSRWGGDEFVMMVNGDPPAEESIESRVSRNLELLRLEATVTAGVTSSAWADDPQPEQLIDLADLRMYGRRDKARARSPKRTRSPGEPESPPPSA